MPAFMIGTSRRRLITIVVLLTSLVLVWLINIMTSQIAVAQTTPGVSDIPQFARQPFAGINDYTLDFAWGDIDNDGDLDLAVGNALRTSWQRSDSDETASGASNYIYENVGGELQSVPLWISKDPGATTALAWGDVNADGWLDLAVSNFESADQVFLNVEGTLEESASWESAEIAASDDLAWGDVNLDGNLDLLIGGYNTPLRIYQSIGQTLPVSATWESAQQTGSMGVAFAHINDDQRPDVVALNERGELCIYLNAVSGLADRADCGEDTNDTPFPLPGKKLSAYHLNDDQFTDLIIANGVDVSIYLNDNGAIADTPQVIEGHAPSRQDGFRANALAVGDVNGDARADIVTVSSWGLKPIVQAYLNLGDRFDTESPETLALPENSNGALALADANQDSLLDVIYSDGGNVLFLNQSLRYQQTTSASLTVGPAYGAAALVDFYGDGKRDVVAYSSPGLELYLNGEIDTPATQLLSSDLALDFRQMVWSDFDQDGDPDVAIHTGDSLLVFENSSAALNPTPVVTSDMTSKEGSDIAWVDIDRDGLPELMRCDDRGVQSVILRDNSASETSRYVFHNLPCSHFVWGDVDNDGDVDAVVAQPGDHKYLYRNQGGVFAAEADWRSADVLPTGTMAMGDLDNDGDLDLAVAIIQGASLAYRNVEGVFETTPFWIAHDDGSSDTVEIIDADGNGWIDVVAGDKIYLNRNGQIAQTGVALSTSESSRTRVLQGDLDANGSGDLLVTTANFGRIFGGSSIQRLRQPRSTSLGIAIDSPGQSVLERTYEVPYKLLGSGFREVRGYYSTNGGGHWQIAVPTSSTITRSLPTGEHVFGWDITASEFYGSGDSVLFKIEALPAFGADGIAAPQQIGRVIATSVPFRVRGQQVRVMQDEMTPAVNALVYRQTVGTNTPGEPIADARGAVYRTDPQGYLQGRGELAAGDRLVALLPISETLTIGSSETGTTTIEATLYHMSASPMESGLESFVVGDGVVQELVVSAENPLLLFNFDISLEWDASNDEPYMAQLRADLRRTSEILFDLFNGQVALGEINIHHAKERWQSADIAIHASSTQRPGANFGGIVSSPLGENLNGTIIENIYWPGQVKMASTWNRFGDGDGTLGEDWPRTLAHELGHYAFFLQDNYHGVRGNALTHIDCQGSAMTDPYREDYSELLQTGFWQGECLNSLNQLATQRNDWETVQNFYPMLRATELMGPLRQPINTLKITEQMPRQNDALIAAQIFYLEDESGNSLPITAGQGDAFLFPKDRPTIVPLSDPSGRLIRARGARVGDEICVFHLRTELRRRVCQEITSNAEATLTLQPNSTWEPEVELALINWQTMHISVTNVADGDGLRAKLYPTLHTLTQTLSTSTFYDAGLGVYTATISVDSYAHAGHLRLWDEGLGNSAETIEQFFIGALSTDFGPPMIGSDGGPLVENQLDGPPMIGSDGGPLVVSQLDGPPMIGSDGGPVVLGQNGPPMIGSDGGPIVLRTANAPINAPDNALIVYDLDNLLAPILTLSLETVSAPPDMPGWLLPLGKTYRLRAAQSTGTNYAIQMRYRERQLPAIDESQLAVYFYDEANPDIGWQPLETNIDTVRNAASTKYVQGGIYMLAATLHISDLERGWNMIGYPLAQSRDVETALQALDGSYKAVFQYDARLSKWLQFFPDLPETWAPNVNSLRALQFGNGYWIYATEASLLNINPGDEAQAVTISSEAEHQRAEMPPGVQPPAIVYGSVENGVAGQQVVAVKDGRECATSTLIDIGDQVGYVLSIGVATCGLSNGDVLELTVEGWPTRRSQIVIMDNSSATFINLSDAP